MTDATEYQLRRQAEAAKALLANLKEIGADDDAELVADSIEGETNLHEAIEAALAEIDESEVLIAGLKAKVEAFRARQSATEARRDRIRALIEQAMAMTEQTKLRLPTATLSLAKRKPAVVIDDEAAIPSRFWTPQPPPPPKLDKAALKDALAEGDVPGAHLDNGGFGLTIRRG